MSQSPPGNGVVRAPAGSASNLVRVTVASSTRRVDLVLPGSVPVAELVPELARSVGLLDSATVYGGYRLVTADGRQLADDSGLLIQGVEDGGLVTVTAGVDDPAPRVYDDVVEAMTDVVEHDLKPWEPAAGRRTALWAAALLLALGGAALLIQGSDLAATAAALVSAVLVVGAIVLSRAEAEPEAAVAVAWVAAGYAAIAGLMFAPAGPLLGQPIAMSAGAVLGVGLVTAVGVGSGRALVLPLVLVGAIFCVTGLLVHADTVDAAVTLTTVLVAVVVAGSVLPWLALGATGTKVDQVYSDADITADPRPVEPEQVAEDARTAHEILVAVSAAVGLLLVLVAPLAVSRGVAGTLLAVMACFVVMLRTRQYRTSPEVLVGLVSGVVGLGVVAVSVLWLHPDWRPATSVVLAVSGAVLLALTLVPRGPSIRRGRIGDLAESTALVSLLPLAVVATGLFEAIQS